MSISGRQFLINRHKPKRMVVRLDFVYISPFCFRASTQNRRRRLFNSVGVTDSKLQQMFFAFIYCSNTCTASFVAFLVLALSLLSTSEAISSSETLAKRAPPSVTPTRFAISNVDSGSALLQQTATTQHFPVYCSMFYYILQYCCQLVKSCCQLVKVMFNRGILLVKIMFKCGILRFIS